MIDREKVIKGLGNVANAIVDGYICEPDKAVNTIADALDLLNMAQSKEMPLKPERYWFNKNLFKCAECRKTLDIIEHNYCPQCGQKIDWSEYQAETEDA